MGMVLSALSIALAACGGSSIDGVDSGGTEDSGRRADAGASCSVVAEQDAVLDIPPACATCLGTSCCSQFGACVDDGACKDIVLCIAGCRSGGGTNASCTPGCSAGTTGAGTLELDALEICVAAHCESACN